MSIFRRFLGLFEKQEDDSGGGDSTVSDVPSQAERPLSVDSMTPIQLFPDDDCTAAELLRIPLIQAKLNAVIMSKCFEDYILRRERIDMMNGRTRQQIVDDMRRPINLTVNYYDEEDTVVDGYEDEEDPRTIHMNRLAVAANGFTICDESSLAGHELSHCHGYAHNGNLADPNYYTVPYTINHAFDSKEDDDYCGGCCCEKS